jgi:hypothetical protein
MVFFFFFFFQFFIMGHDLKPKLHEQLSNRKMERELIIHIPIEGSESIVEIEDDEARTVLVEPDHLQCLVLHLFVVFHEKVFAALNRQGDYGTRVRPWVVFHKNG